MLKESDFNYLKEILGKNPDLRDAFFNCKFDIEDPGDIGKVKNMINYPLLICENPDKYLKEVQKQINFILPPEMRKSKDLYVKNIKNDINMYKKLYEKFSTIVNKIINETKECLKNLYKPFKSLHDDINKYSKNFDKSIEQLTIPLKNGKKGLDDIKYENYSKDKQNLFNQDKKEIIEEIDNFIQEASEFYSKYKTLNKATSDDISNFVERFKKLPEPAIELSKFMTNFIKVFEQSSKYFNNLNNKKQIDERLQKIKEPILEFQKKKNNIERVFSSIKKDIKIEKLNEMIEISNEIKDKINKLEVSSGKISDKIKEIREKYGEPEQTLAEIDIEPAPIVNTQKVSKEVEKQQEKIEKTASSIVAEMSKYIEKAKEQTRLDLLFIMDITNSMDFYLNQVKQYILKMIEDIQIECAGSEINLGFIGYRDFNDLDFGDEYIDLEFTTDYESIRKRIEYVTAQGGGDIPEDLCGALELGKNKKWSGNTRFAILVTDSPCHGNKYHNLSGDQEDNYPDGDREGRNIEDYIKFFSEEKISLYCLKINNTTDKMFDIFEKVYNKNKKENSKNEFIVEEGQKLIDIVTKNAVNMFQNRDKLEIS
jgi:hypothetical protein